MRRHQAELGFAATKFTEYLCKRGNIEGSSASAPMCPMRCALCREASVICPVLALSIGPKKFNRLPVHVVTARLLWCNPVSGVPAELRDETLIV